MRRLTEWWNRGDDFAQPRSVSSASTPGTAPDFLAQTDDPDKPRVRVFADSQQGKSLTACKISSDVVPLAISDKQACLGAEPSPTIQ